MFTINTHISITLFITNRSVTTIKTLQIVCFPSSRHFSVSSVCNMDEGLPSSPSSENSSENSPELNPTINSSANNNNNNSNATPGFNKYDYNDYYDDPHYNSAVNSRTLVATSTEEHIINNNLDTSYLYIIRLARAFVSDKEVETVDKPGGGSLRIISPEVYSEAMDCIDYNIKGEKENIEVFLKVLATQTEAVRDAEFRQCDRDMQLDVDQARDNLDTMDEEEEFTQHDYNDMLAASNEEMAERRAIAIERYNESMEALAQTVEALNEKYDINLDVNTIREGARQDSENYVGTAYENIPEPGGTPGSSPIPTTGDSGFESGSSD